MKGVTKIKYMTKGHRGILYTGTYKGRKVVIKKKNPESRAIGRIKNEGDWLKIINKQQVGPRLIRATPSYFLYYYVDGPFLPGFLEECTKSQAKKVIKAVFEQCWKLDSLGVAKEEMHRPYKHIVVPKTLKPVLLDFERTHRTEKPKNVTQFCQYITGGKIRRMLQTKGYGVNQKKVRTLAKKYKSNRTKTNLKAITDEIFRSSP